jgi:peroxiredoxin
LTVFRKEGGKMKIKTILSILFILMCFVSTTTAQQVVKSEKPIGAGDTAPDFTLEDENGKSVKLSSSRGKEPVVLVFYRGYWCPYCARQLAELRSLLLPNEKAKLYAISIDPHDKSKGLIEKLSADGKGKINFPFLSDPEAKTIDSYGIRSPAYAGTKYDGIPYPTVYVIDKSGKVAWMKLEEDYKKRPTNAEIRAEIDKAK